MYCSFKKMDPVKCRRIEKIENMHIHYTQCKKIASTQTSCAYFLKSPSNLGE